MTIAIYPGSFDPITNGHIDILKSGVEIFDKVIIAVSYNSQKKGFLPIDIREKLIQASVAGIKNVEVISFEGLTVEFAKKCGANVLLRGLRNSADFEYEIQLSQINNTLNSEIKTVFLTSKPEHNFISSSVVKEVLSYKGDVSQLVPEPVAEYFMKQY
jgi:pantetheine-phosphate adenylyltransferase